MIRFLIKVGVISGLWLAIDMESEEAFSNTLAPLVFGLSLMIWVFWVLLKMADKELSQHTKRGTGTGIAGGRQSPGGSSDSDGGGGGDGSC